MSLALQVQVQVGGPPLAFHNPRAGYKVASAQGNNAWRKGAVLIRCTYNRRKFHYYMTAHTTCTAKTQDTSCPFDFELANEVKKEGGSATQDCRTVIQVALRIKV
eukprot:scaffold5217_cov80-Skeletonema_dohrnii-CCMP3373.AAC.4